MNSEYQKYFYPIFYRKEKERETEILYYNNVIALFYINSRKIDACDLPG